MPNKTWNMEVDMIPPTTNTHNLGTAEKKWKLNGSTVGDAVSKNVDTSITSTSSQNVPTTQAIVNWVENRTPDIVVSGTTLVVGATETTIVVQGTTVIIP